MNDGRFSDDELVHLEAEQAVGIDGRRPVFANVADWVRDVVLPAHRRPLDSDTKWCPYWWEHTEAVARLEATWRAWEHLRHEGPTGPAVWFRDYFDPMMVQLTSRTGPFHACKTDARGGHQVPARWDIAEPPHGLFRDADHSEEH